jgi:hypothetical protein
MNARRFFKTSLVGEIIRLFVTDIGPVKKQDCL